MDADFVFSKINVIIEMKTYLFSFIYVKYYLCKSVWGQTYNEISLIHPIMYDHMSDIFFN